MNNNGHVNKTVNGLLWGGVFSILSQIVGLLFSIILARLLSPSDYGLVGMLAIFSAIATLLQESGFVFVLTNKKDVTHEEYCTVFWFNVTVSTILYCLLFVLSPFIASFFNEPKLIKLSRVVFLSFFVSSFGVVQSALLYKKLKVRERGVITIMSQVLSGTIGVVLALNGMSYWGIAIQALSATIITTILFWLFSPFRPSLIFRLDLLMKFLPDGIRFAFPNLFATISGNIYSVVLGKFFTVREVGLYNQASKFNKVGYGTVLNIFRNVSQPSLAMVKDDQEKLLSTFRYFFRLIVFLTIPVMMAISLVSSELIIILLSEKWTDAGIILRILCIGGAFINISTMFSYLVISLGKSTTYMNLGILVSFLNIIAVLVSIRGGVIWLALLASVVCVVEFVLYYLVIKKEMKYTLNMLLSDLLPVLVISTILYIIVFYGTLTINNMLNLLIVRILAFGGGFLILVVVFKIRSYKEIRFVVNNFLKKI